MLLYFQLLDYCGFFFYAPASTEIYTLSLHDALPISGATKRRESISITRELSSEAIGGSYAAFTEGLTRLGDRKSTRLNSSHSQISYAVFCLKKKKPSFQYRLLLLVYRLTDVIIFPASRLLWFFFLCSRVHRDLHSFPTRRSSDLGCDEAA